MAWPCFWVEENGEAEHRLRRFAWKKDDEDHLHSASVPTGTYHPVHHTEDHSIKLVPSEEYSGSLLWPTHCDCGYAFTDDDQWQVHQDVVYVRPDTGQTWHSRLLPIGALYDAPWFGHFWNATGPDGLSLMCVLPKPDGAGGWVPDHPWHVDGPASGGGRISKPNAWTRTGDPKAVPPTVDVNPSILTNYYHGYLRHGVLTDPV